MDANVDSTRTSGQQASAQDAQTAPELAAPQAKPAKKAVPDAANFRLLEEACASYLDAEGMEKAERAYRFAADFHRDQRRRSGEALHQPPRRGGPHPLQGPPHGRGHHLRGPSA